MTRTTVLLAVVTAVAAGPIVAPASATTRPKPKPLPPVCKLLVDPADQTSSPALDIVSADVATGRTSLTWVVRVVNLNSTSDASTTAGRQWTLVYVIGGKKITNAVTDGPLGPTDRSGNGAVVAVNTSKNEVRYTLPLAKLNATYGVNVVPGSSVLTGFEASSSGLVQPIEATGLAQNLPGGDQAGPSDRKYIAGRRSCVGSVA